MVEPTHLKNMLVKLDHLLRDRGEHKKIFETTTQYLMIWSTSQCISLRIPKKGLSLLNGSPFPWVPIIGRGCQSVDTPFHHLSIAFSHPEPTTVIRITCGPLGKGRSNSWSLEGYISYICIHTWKPNDPSFGWKFGLVLRGPDLQKKFEVWIDTIEIALSHTN